MSYRITVKVLGLCCLSSDRKVMGKKYLKTVTEFFEHRDHPLKKTAINVC